MRTLAKLLGILLLTGVAALAWSFAPRRLPVAAVAVDALPPASPPAGMTISVLPTGAMHSKAAFSYRGGSFAEPRDFSMPAILIRHPRGDLLVDAGFGRGVAAHARGVPWLMRVTSTWTAAVPAADQLVRGGYDVGRLAGVLVTHAHWDHVSGVPDLPAPVWMNADERRFVESGAPMASLMRSFAGAKVREYAWDGGPYLGFPRSHDWYGDGAVVLVPVSGHTPGSVAVFVTLPSGARYALVGDLVWQREGLDLPAERPWLSRLLVDEDAAEVRSAISQVAALHRRFPEIVVVPTHDARATAELPAFPASRG
jgi:glyoxylase-like metal-dependent hydrolase (beta-lactamase superfamily II)